MFVSPVDVLDTIIIYYKIILMSNLFLIFLRMVDFVIHIYYICIMSNKNPYRIPNSQRGHRPRINPEEKTMVLQTPMPESMFKKCRDAGTKRVREKLAEIE
jgi:hypothetical protein